MGSKIRVEDTLVEEDAGVLRWPLPEQFVSSPEVAYRNRFAAALAECPVGEIVERFVYLTPEQMEGLLETSFRAVGAAPLRGIGVELGAGCGLLSSTVARRPEVQKMFAVEVCEVAVTRLISKVAAELLGEKARAVIPVVGSFDDLRLPDNSVDFVVEIDSLHHSGNLANTFRECYRVLKPGGQMVCFDRCHPNSLTDQKVDEMLSEVYSKHFLAANAYPTDIILTRRENGEHEYRLYEWQRGFEAGGLRLRKASKLAKEVPFRKAVKGCLSLAPAVLRRRIYQTDDANLGTTLEWLWQPVKNLFAKSHIGRPVLAPKETTVFLLDKPE